ncbi:FecR family protein [Acidovorax sp. CCYZU-2555]|uniref:FecR domain-containing protein n=1 Tax=Acidovorax sp. CCYZU-2555 TaxID=2835042 RepID=UPI001BCED031|nr:FecR family protein [Acidovorax sp. CCYZU-2555]MBS7777113.1 FecR family protein [Acidovorax sp. CCYZU-2555]
MSRALPDPALIREAIGWLVEARSGEMTPRQWAQLQQWRQSSSQHEAAWQAVDRAVGRNVHPLVQQTPLQQQAAVGALVRPRRRHVVSGSFALAGVLASTGWIANRLTPLSGLLADAHTATGELRTLDLPDGSQLLLAPRSIADLDFNAERRLVRLSQGALIATVTPDQARPFIVATAQGEVRALGTRYLVRQTPEDTQVAVLQHRVVLRSRSGGAQELGEGRCAWIMADGRIRADDRRAKEAAAWQHGMLLANDESLGDVIAALRPYRAGLLRISPEAARLRVLGAFALDNTDHALQALADNLPIRIQRYSAGWLTTIDT